MRSASRHFAFILIWSLVWLTGCTSQSTPTTLLPSSTQQPSVTITPVVLLPGTPAAALTPTSVGASSAGLAPTPLVTAPPSNATKKLPGRRASFQTTATSTATAATAATAHNHGPLMPARSADSERATAKAEGEQVADEVASGELLQHCMGLAQTGAEPHYFTDDTEGLSI